MSMADIPDRTQEQAFVDLLESIAFEEVGIAHIINAEGEKIQAIKAGLESGKYSPEEAVQLQHTVVRVMRSAIKMQMLLQFKLENLLEFDPRIPVTDVFSNTVTAEGTYQNEVYTDTDMAYYQTIKTCEDKIFTGEVNLDE